MPSSIAAKSALEAALTVLLSEALPSRLWREIPPGTQLRSVTMRAGTAQIDLSQEFLTNLTNNMNVGFIKESLLYTAYQFPDVLGVIITIEGQPAGYMNGQNLGGPFSKLEQPAPPEMSGPIGGQVNPLSLVAPAPKVFIDPGHGGTDPGAVASDGTQEKTINLAVALKLKSYVESNNGYVSMTRTGDTYVRYGLNDPRRTSPLINGSDAVTVAQLANTYNADLFVSIHSNATGSSAVRGFEIYYASNHATAYSQDMATRISGAFQLRYVTRGVFSNAIPSAGYAVLNETTMTAVLAELAFLTNSQDLALLKSDTEQDWMAYYLYRGIRDYWCQGQACIWER